MKNQKIYQLSVVGEFFILFIIFINMVILGLETIPTMTKAQIENLHLLDRICLGIFIVEIIVKFIFCKLNHEKFFASRWNIFDTLIIILSLIPEIGFLSILRVFKTIRSVKVIRVLKSIKAIRTMKLVSSMNELKKIFKAIVISIPGIAWTVVLLALFYYIYAIIGVNLFSTYLPQMFGSLPKAIFTLFQVMTFESWCMGIARPLLEVYSWAWLYFITFILLSTYLILNVVVGIVVNSISEVNNEKSAKSENNENLKNIENGNLLELKKELQILKNQIDKIEGRL